MSGGARTDELIGPGPVLYGHSRVVYGWYRRQARQQGHADPRCGSVTFVQRFGSALNPHFHVLVADGAYVSDEQGRSTFVPASTLTDEGVQAIVETTAHRVVWLLQRRGLQEQDATDPLWEDEPLLAALTAASIQGRVATGERRGERVRRRLVDPEEGVQTGPLCFASRGFSLHAATRIAGPDSAGLERLCRYVMRPPLAAGRLRVMDGDHLSFALKTPWRDDHHAPGAVPY